MLFALLAEKFPTARAIADALGISRQAYSQATKRGRLSDSAILRAAELLKLDPGALLVERAQLATVKRDESPAPIPPPSPALGDADAICQTQFLYYVKSDTDKACTAGKTSALASSPELLIREIDKHLKNASFH